ncbi:MAG: helix-turn-helix transcriptional regulator [Myxococcaceae bacterium]
MLSYPEAARVLGLALGTLYAMVHQRRIPHVRLGPRLVRFRRNELDAWLAGRSVPEREEAAVRGRQ